MKFTVARADLLSAVAACAAVADTKSPIVSNGCTLLEATTDGLRVRASNGLQSVRFDVQAKVDVPGSALVRAPDLAERVDNLTVGDVSVTANEKSLELRRERQRYSLALFDPKLASAVSPVSGASCKVDAAAFVALLGRIAPETGLDDAGPFRSGVFLDATGAQLAAWAWNGVALVKATMDADGSLDCLLPVVSLRHLRRLLGKVKGPIDVGVCGSDMFVRAERLVYTTRLPEVSRPPFDAVVQAAVPRSGGHRVTLGRQAFGDAVRAVMGGHPKESRVHLHMVDGGLLLWGRSVAGEISEQIVPAQGTFDSLSLSGVHLSIAAGFYGDTDEIELRKHETPKDHRSVDGDPGQVTLLDPARSDLCVITPMRLSVDDIKPELAA